MNLLYDAPTLVIVSSKPNEKAPTIGLANASCIIENMSLAGIALGYPTEPLTNEEELKQTIETNIIK